MLYMTGRENNSRVTWQQAEMASLAPESHEISELERILKVIQSNIKLNRWPSSLCLPISNYHY